ncbi:helix-turn-helix domain-containing protein [Micromonospora sp. NPDC005806]|uniref:helix-turn-helix domain-containing protein n=1 Tax=Micromonospora sp. NPDC005806 TaxID=3364234 RepID=UPI00368D8C0B
MRRTDNRAVYSVREVARLLSLSLGSTYALVRDGEIPARKLGGRWVIPKKRFRAWLDECTETATDDAKGWA